MKRRSDRVMPFYPRITKINKLWIKTATKKSGVQSESFFIDRLISAARENYKPSELKKLMTVAA